MSSSGPSPITAEQLAALPPEMQALVRAIVDHYERRLVEQDRRITELAAELQSLRKAPQNSSLPPSTQHPHARPVSVAPKSSRPRGGQPGHSKHERMLIPNLLDSSEARLQSLIDAGGDGTKIGVRLRASPRDMFHHWHRDRDGTLQRWTMRNNIRKHCQWSV